jgi:hypothetical protein
VGDNKKSHSHLNSDEKKNRIEEYFFVNQIRWIKKPQPNYGSNSRAMLNSAHRDERGSGGLALDRKQASKAKDAQILGTHMHGAREITGTK